MGAASRPRNTGVDTKRTWGALRYSFRSKASGWTQHLKKTAHSPNTDGTTHAALTTSQRQKHRHTMTDVEMLHACPDGQLCMGPEKTAPEVPSSHPILQELQPSTPIEPGLEYGVVAGHTVHSATPTEAPYRPAGHTSQRWPAAAKVPPRHSTCGKGKHMEVLRKNNTKRDAGAKPPPHLHAPLCVTHVPWWTPPRQLAQRWQGCGTTQCDQRPTKVGSNSGSVVNAAARAQAQC
jgi:hypothetical protein